MAMKTTDSQQPKNHYMKRGVFCQHNLLQRITKNLLQTH